MKKLILMLAVVMTATMLFIGCSSNGVSSSDVSSLVNGPNKIKGTITGTMLDNSSYKIDYDYHVTTNDGNSESESWIQDGGTYDGDTIIWVGQYFYFDRNGYSDYGDGWSASGQYIYMDVYFHANSLKQLPNDYNNHYMEGNFQMTTSAGNRFVYDTEFSAGNSNPGTMDVTNLKYDKTTQLLTGKLNVSMPDNNDNYSRYNNHKATTITGDFTVYVPKENFQVTNKGTYYGQVYRKRGK